MIIGAGAGNDAAGGIRQGVRKITAVEIANVMGESNIVLTVDEKDRGIAIGKEGERIKAAKEFLKKKSIYAS